MAYLRSGMFAPLFTPVMISVLILALISVSGCAGGFLEKEPVRVISEPQTTTYCYRSLANVDCYEQPVPEDERTLLIPTE